MPASPQVTLTRARNSYPRVDGGFHRTAVRGGAVRCKGRAFTRYDRDRRGKHTRHASGHGVCESGQTRTLHRPSVNEPTARRLTAHDVYFFREGTHRRLYERMGCQLSPQGAQFAVWAPNAERVAVIGDFNGWDAAAHPLAPRWEGSGVWEGEVPGVQRGQAYKYRIESRHGDYRIDKADPLAFYAEVPPGTASRACW